MAFIIRVSRFLFLVPLFLFSIASFAEQEMQVESEPIVEIKMEEENIFESIFHFGNKNSNWRFIPSAFKETGPLLLIRDPNPDQDQRQAPFIMNFPTPDGEDFLPLLDAKRYCKKIKGELPTKGQLEAIIRASTVNGVYNANCRNNLCRATVWSKTSYPKNTIVSYVLHYSGGIYLMDSTTKFMQAICVLPFPGH